VLAGGFTHGLCKKNFCQAFVDKKSLQSRGLFLLAVLTRTVVNIRRGQKIETYPQKLLIDTCATKKF
jgi:hypothetical protein